MEHQSPDHPFLPFSCARSLGNIVVPFFTLGVVSLTAMTAVAPAAGAQESGRVRDSMGLRIIEHGELRRPAPFKIAEQPLVDFGGLRTVPSEEVDPRNPMLVARPLSDGRWVVVDWMMLRVFDGRARYIRTIGRPGRGPGELGQVRDICITAGDTIITLGLMDRRLAVFDSSGTPVSTTDFPYARMGADACLGDGTILVRGPAVPTGEANDEQVAQVDRVRWDGTPVAPFGLLPAEGLDGMVGVSANIAASGDRVYVGNGNTPEYRVYSGFGKLVQIVRWRARLRRVSPSWREGLMRSGRYMPGPVQREFLPFYDTIRPAAGNAVWVQDYEIPGASRGYSVFDADGGFVGRVEALAGTSRGGGVGWVGVDRILLTWRDDDGAPHLTLHRIVAR